MAGFYVGVVNANCYPFQGDRAGHTQPLPRIFTSRDPGDLTAQVRDFAGTPGIRIVAFSPALPVSDWDDDQNWIVTYAMTVVYQERIAP